MLKITWFSNKLAFTKNDRNKPILKKNNSNNKDTRFGINNNSIRVINKLRKLKKLSKFKKLSKNKNLFTNNIIKKSSFLIPNIKIVFNYL